jgi:3-deoxy-D-manno-octulosonic-acid transferase
MLLLYNIVIQLYFYFISFVSIFNKKAKKWLSGRKKNIQNLNEGSIWFHFASLGEFEQGRPVLEKIRALYPDDKIVLTFFSPSGYEIRKNTPLANAVYYLPLDTAKKARHFIDAIKPKFAVFTKYEYWYHFFDEMHKREIPLYIISGIFRPGQIFFKWYGSLHRKILGFVTYFFVQDDASKLLLSGIGINKVKVSGDTRFDRVWQNAQHPQHIPYMAEFNNRQKMFVAGSTWPPDEKLLSALISEHPDWKFVIAPHEIREDKITALVNLLPAQTTARYSQFKSYQEPFTTYQTLIIDNIGMLSSLYQYGDIAYIGGGFGAGIHNTLEAAAFGLPVIFGPNYSKFIEAKELIQLQAGFSINDEFQLKEVFEKITSDDKLFKSTGERSFNFVKDHIGATDMILNEIFNTIKNIK